MKPLLRNLFVPFSFFHDHGALFIQYKTSHSAFIAYVYHVTFSETKTQRVNTKYLMMALYQMQYLDYDLFRFSKVLFMIVKRVFIPIIKTFIGSLQSFLLYIYTKSDSESAIIFQGKVKKLKLKPAIFFRFF